MEWIFHDFQLYMYGSDYADPAYADLYSHTDHYRYDRERPVEYILLQYR
jgi:hypothetical protein